MMEISDRVRREAGVDDDPNAEVELEAGDDVMTDADDEPISLDD
jgi:hypothetical protein